MYLALMGLGVYALGICTGWFLGRRNMVILTEKSIDEGLAEAKNAAKKRAETYEKDFRSKIDALMGNVKSELQNKLGLDNQDPRPHTNEEPDDGVNISREDRPL